MTTMAEGEGAPLDWEALAPLIAHPVREAIIEVLRHIGEPLSANDLFAIFGTDQSLSVSCIAFQLERLVSAEALVRVAERSTAVGFEQLYFFPLAA